MCGIGGAWGGRAGERVRRMAPWLMHRGQEGVGYAYIRGGEIALGEPGDDAEGALVHTRYSTSGEYGVQLQPVLAKYRDLEIAVVFNGTVVNYRRLGVENPGFDGDALAKALAREIWERGVEQGVISVYSKIVGAASLLALTPWGLLAVRDPRGIRPLAYKHLGDGVVFASEDVAIEGGIEVPPGLAFLYGRRVAFWKIPPGVGKICALEYVYFAHHATKLGGRLVLEVREALGKALAELETEGIDVVTYVPETSRLAALSYASALGKPLVDAVVKNRYAGRIFIAPPHARLPSDAFRVVPELVRGKNVALVDDSIIRGTNIKTVVAKLKEAGAKKVHVRIASPPVRWPCFFGMDFQTRKELIAHGRSEEQVRSLIGADTLKYLPLEKFREIIGEACYACFTGEYPQKLDIKQAEAELGRAPA
ncbi:amidophosphoribosyltransferase [Pyrobaculum aerophilum]|uniref:amidophosphoribosyltransferase n=1 Tax=Pyrobaculum aerophilum TaxID=13773 RepID=UPI0023F3BEEF|nr:amidophosphoribosyltransferase [Pyrobaculum aerophilum]MCX8137168.1 amidophosphoribosyltransferase [Pyrobaculum aerophilum]